MEALLERGTDVENWNDERLDELSRRMDAGFDKAATKVELTALKNEMNIRFDEVGGRFNEFGKRFDKIEGRLDRLNSTLLIGLFGLIAAVIANGIWG
jgi:hypothetical protein